jgi:D-serine deaminase-like pyridoxal phosphate-dependent protein
MSRGEAWTGLLEPLRAATSARASVDDDVFPTPLVYVDLDRLERNLDEMAARAAASGVRLRPHVKTHKITAIAHMQLDRGACGLTVATVSEAEALRTAGVNCECLVALPWSAGGAERAIDRDPSGMILSVDSFELASRLSRRAAGRGHVVRVAIVVDNGYRRFGVPPSEASALASQCAELPNIEVVGIHSHAGQAYGMPNPEDRRQLSLAEVEAMSSVAKELRARDFELAFVSVGSTPAAAQLLGGMDLGAVNEVRPGNYAFLDAQQIALGVDELERCALRVVASVVACDRARGVLDAGLMTLSHASDDFGHGAIIGHPGARIAVLSQESAIVTEAPELRLGDRVEIVPVHACEITTLAPLVYYGRGGAVEGAWNVDARACVW